jgi:hypothetical protein
MGKVESSRCSRNNCSIVEAYGGRGDAIDLTAALDDGNELSASVSGRFRSVNEYPVLAG